MPRLKRIWLPDSYYHIGCRGNRRDPLFFNDSDFQTFFHILCQLHEKIPFEISSYCFMTNHYHLQIKSPEVPFSKLMSYINKRYANYYNTKYELTGHVFEKRFYDKAIYDQEAMLHASRYIHFNPVEAGITGKPENYPWSSYQFYKKPNSAGPPGFMNLNSILNFFTGITMEERMERYCAAIEVPIEVPVTTRNLSTFDKTRGVTVTARTDRTSFL